MFSVLALLLIGAAISTQARSLPPTETPTVTKNVLPEHKHTAACENTGAEPVQIICILDRSGSMQPLTEDVIGGYNSFLEKQKKEEGAAEVTTILFDDKYEKIADAVNLSSAENLTPSIYYARGNTALMDAVGRTITTTLGEMEKNNICPAKRRVLIMIMTDGLENASTEYSKARVKELIESTTKEYNWNYVFIGANIDSAAEANSIGIGARHAANYSPDSEGVRDSFNRMDEAAKDVRQKGSVSENWGDDN
ncbi:MAG: VWA domain-containing protein [Selenomonadaceae bacterium]|nr:VWA domain-containing protein [Selenomonadaceae bacterium]MBQ7629935.1 VWA domain-containing protein [Selenomonadaceae bacterium]